MSTAPKILRPRPPATPVGQGPVPDHLFGWPEIAAALLASKGITKGWWRVGMQLRFGALTTRMGDPGQEQKSVPTAIVGIDSVAIFATDQGGDLVYDAANGCAPVPVGAVAPKAAKPVPKGKKIVITRTTSTSRRPVG